MTSAAGKTEIDADVRQGTQEDAIWFSLGANAEWDRVGKKRTRADVQRAIERALRHANGAGKSDRQIAEHVGCDHKTVGKARERMGASGEIPQMPTREVTRNGVTYQQDTTNIGRRTVPVFAAAGPVSPEVKDDAEPVIVNAHTLCPNRFSRCALTTT